MRDEIFLDIIKLKIANLVDDDLGKTKEEVSGQVTITIDLDQPEHKEWKEVESTFYHELTHAAFVLSKARNHFSHYCDSEDVALIIEETVANKIASLLTHPHIKEMLSYLRQAFEHKKHAGSIVYLDENEYRLCSWQPAVEQYPMEAGDPKLPDTDKLPGDMFKDVQRTPDGTPIIGPGLVKQPDPPVLPPTLKHLKQRLKIIEDLMEHGSRFWGKGDLDKIEKETKKQIKEIEERKDEKKES